MKKCFVVVGFNEKTDPATGRVLDLDKTYRGKIKSVAEAAGYECLRAVTFSERRFEILPRTIQDLQGS